MLEQASELLRDIARDDARIVKKVELLQFIRGPEILTIEQSEIAFEQFKVSLAVERLNRYLADTDYDSRR